MKSLCGLRIPLAGLATCLTGLWGGEWFWFPAPLWHHLISPVQLMYNGKLHIKEFHFFSPGFPQFSDIEMQRNALRKKYTILEKCTILEMSNFFFAMAVTEIRGLKYIKLFHSVLSFETFCFMKHSRAKSIVFHSHCQSSVTASSTPP